MWCLLLPADHNSKCVGCTWGAVHCKTLSMQQIRGSGGDACDYLLTHVQSVVWVASRSGLGAVGMHEAPGAGGIGLLTCIQNACAVLEV